LVVSCAIRESAALTQSLLCRLAARGDDVLRAQMQASDAQKRSLLAAHNLSPDEWQLLVELFL
jgi:hypothetical protein